MPNADRRRFISFAYGRSRLPRTANELVRLLCALYAYVADAARCVCEGTRAYRRPGPGGGVPGLHDAACGTSLAFSRRAQSPPLPPFSRVSPTVCVFAMAQVHKFKLSLLTDGGGRAEHFLPKSHSCFFHIERTCRTRLAATRICASCLIPGPASRVGNTLTVITCTPCLHLRLVIVLISVAPQCHPTPACSSVGRSWPL